MSKIEYLNEQHSNRLVVLDYNEILKEESDFSEAIALKAGWMIFSKDKINFLPLTRVDLLSAKCLDGKMKDICQ